MLTITVDEWVPHPGHYRVALALNSREELMQLKDPDVLDKDGKVITSGDSVSAVIQNPVVFPVIADNVLPHTSGGNEQTAMIQLPNVNCDHCVLQVIEFMAQHAPDYFYRHCADLKITADPSKPIFDPTGMGGSGNMGGMGGGGAGGSSAGASAGGAAGTAGMVSGGAPGTAGAPGAGAPGTAGVPAGGTPGTAGTGTTGGGNAQDDGGCSVSSAGMGSMTGVASLAASLLLGLGWLARRRDRPE